MVVKQPPEPPPRRPSRRPPRRRRKRSPKKEREEGRRPPKKELTEEEKARQAEERERAAAERRARLAEAVKNTGILKVLGAKADGEGSIADVLGKGDVDRDQEKAFQGVGGLTVATGDAALRGVKTGTGGGGKVASIGGLRGGGEHRRRQHRQRRPRAQGHRHRARPRPRPSTASWTPGIVAKEVRARMGAITGLLRALPEAQPEPQRQDRPALDHHRRPAPCRAWTSTSDTMGDAEVVSCIKSLVARWRFPAPRAARSRSRSRSCSRRVTEPIRSILRRKSG